MPTKGADEYAVVELLNDVICSGFTEVLVRSDNERAILAPEGVGSDSFETGRCECQDCGKCTVRLAKQQVGRERCERCERCRENEFGLPRQTLWTGVSRRTPSPDLACEVLHGDGEQVQERSRWQDSLWAAQGAEVREITASFGGEDPFHDPWSHETGGESRSKMGRRNLPWCV